MALMPESWLNMPMETARKIGSRYLRENNGSSPCPCSASIGADDLLQAPAVVLLAGQPQHFSRFLHAALLRQPARAARNGEQHQQEKRRREAPRRPVSSAIRGAQVASADEIIRKIRQQNAEDDVELEEAHQPPAPFRGRDFGDVHRPQHGRSADAQSADEPEQRPANTSSRRRRSRARRSGRARP